MAQSTMYSEPTGLLVDVLAVPRADVAGLALGHATLTDKPA